MKQQKTVKEIAEILDEAAFSANSTTQISLDQDLNLKEAYEIQAESIARRQERGELLTGYKLGFTSKAKMEQMGVHEIIWGRLTDKMYIPQNGELNRAAFIHPRVEPEIAFLISKCIDRPIRLEEVSDYLGGVAGALEIIDSRYENFKFSLEDVIADNCSSSGYVIGEWKDPSTSVQDLAIALQINGEQVQSGNSNAILGNPIESLIEITRILSERGIQIEADMIILAGAATSAVHIHTGDKIEGHFKDLGIVKLQVV